MYSYLHKCYLGNYWVDAKVMSWDPVINIEIWDPCTKKFIIVFDVSHDELIFKTVTDDYTDD